MSSLSPAQQAALTAAILPRWNEFLDKAAAVENAKAGKDGAFPSATQTAFLLLDHIEDLLFGGAAGGGKSSAVLAGAAQYVDCEGYKAMLFRRKFTDLEQPDALIPRSHEWFGNTKAHWRGDERQWTFPTGAVIRFGYMDHLGDEQRYQGSAAHYYGFDEAGQFEPAQMQYLKTRARRPASSRLPIRFRYSANPGGIAHQWLYDEFMISGRATGKIFIPSFARDNPGLDVADYMRRLDAVKDPILRAQLRDGDWTAIDRSSAIVPEWTKDLALCCIGNPPLPNLYTAYMVMDVGSRDLTVCLFAVWDFVAAKLRILREVVLKDPSTQRLGREIRRVHDELFAGNPAVERVFGFSDIDWRLIRDLREEFGLSFAATAKADKLAAHNATRSFVGEERMTVDSSCETLLATLEGGQWNQTRTDYQRSEATGHADAWDALVYLHRNVQKDRNPFPLLQDPNPLAARRPAPQIRNARALAGAFGAGRFKPL